MLYDEYNLTDDTINKIYKTINKYKGGDYSLTTCTENGFQTGNIINLFSKSLIKKILPTKKMYEGLFHFHYIKYNQGGFQAEHNHDKTEKYSCIVYLNSMEDGYTIFKKPINKKILPEKGKVIIFDADILHSAEESSAGKEILVGAIDKKIL